MRWSSRASATSISTSTSQKAGLDVWIDPPDPGWGSVIGNALDGGGGWTASPFRDHFGAHCGMEVVLAERRGRAHRHGRAAELEVAGSTTAGATVPWVDGLFRQANMGVVTKMGFYLMPRPEAMQMSTVTSTRDEDIVPLLDALNLLENQHRRERLHADLRRRAGSPARRTRRVDDPGADLRAGSRRARADGVLRKRSSRRSRA